MEICIAVADWARGPTTWVLDVPGGEGTDARRRRRNRRVVHTASRSGSAHWTGRGAGMVVGWG
ncbi:hypothetical protein F3L20_02475 [Streptomyces tendae]|uniref:Uncharacterized protein n=1 Tax=Streptomyces tendae TaxID=1932 RepID=A0ABX5ZZ13_STRTE|nr:hypothetical protein F3L20_02475 [Streptomyces tendae]